MHKRKVVVTSFHEQNAYISLMREATNLSNYELFVKNSESVRAKSEKLREIMITEHSLGKVAEGISKAYA